MIPEIRDDRQMRALTGVPTEKFSTLEAAFALAIDDEKNEHIEKALPKETVKENQVVGKKGNYPLRTKNLHFCCTT